MIREGTILVDKVFSKWLIAKGMRFLGPSNEHGLDLLLIPTVESDDPLTRVYLVDPRTCITGSTELYGCFFVCKGGTDTMSYGTWGEANTSVGRTEKKGFFSKIVIAWTTIRR